MKGLKEIFLIRLKKQPEKYQEVKDSQVIPSK